MSPHKIYFKARGNDKHGPKITVPGFGAGSHSDESLMAIPAGFITKSKPTAKELKQLIFQNRAKHVDLYIDKNSNHHVHSNSTVDITAHGNDKAHPLLFIDKNHDAEEDEDEEEEAEEEAIDHPTTYIYTSNPGPQAPAQTGNICGNPACGRTFICNADYNRHVQPMGYPGV